MSYLKGTWQECGGMPYITTCKFSKKYCTYVYSDGNKSKVPIKEIVKTSYGYFIKISGTNGNYGYRLETKKPNDLTYVGTWDTSSMDGYSGSSSLWKP